jgi:hypothetical protein
MITTAYLKKLAMSAAALAAIGVAAMYVVPSISQSAMSRQSQAAQPEVAMVGASQKVVATVDGRPIMDVEVMQMANQNGAPPQVALDEMVSREAAAGEALRLFPGKASQALEAAKREILFGLYVRERAAAIDATITDKDVSDDYAKNIKPEDFRLYKLRVGLTSTSEEAAKLEKLDYLGTTGDHFVKLSDVPYGMGAAVKRLQKGQRSAPLGVRNGFFVFVVEDIRDGKIPELKEIEREIRSSISRDRLVREINLLRSKSKIELKG